MVQAGLGISLIPEMALLDAPNDGIIFRSLDGVRPRRAIALALFRQRKSSLCVIEFTKFVRDQRPRTKGTEKPPMDANGRGVAAADGSHSCPCAVRKIRVGKQNIVCDTELEPFVYPLCTYVPEVD
jgi:hypothetical protein